MARSNLNDSEEYELRPSTTLPTSTTAGFATSSLRDPSVRSSTLASLDASSVRNNDATSSLEVSDVKSSTTYREVMICFSAFCVVFTACGLNFAFGVYQALYEDMASQPNTPFSGVSQGEIGLIGTLSVAFMQIAAPLASAWIKRFSPKIVLALGGVLFFTACMLASFSNSLWQFLLTEGFLLGLGTCLAYITAVTVTPTWYTRRRGLAMGIILSGTGVGGLVWAPAVQAMNERLGFRMGLRITGAVAIVVMSAATLVLDWDDVSKARLRQDPDNRRKDLGRFYNIPLVNWRIAKSKAFAAQAFATTFHGAAYYIPLFFFSSYAQTLAYSTTAGANFIAINNACNAIGKIIIGFLADRYLGQVNTLLITSLISTTGTVALWVPSTLLNGKAASRPLFIAFSLANGTFTSAYVSLFPACLVEIFGPAQFASINGLLYMLRGFGGLAGAPIAGVLIKNAGAVVMPRSYWGPAVMVSALLAATSLSVSWVWYETRKQSRSAS